MSMYENVMVRYIKYVKNKYINRKCSHEIVKSKRSLNLKIEYTKAVFNV
jgi:hypothetical protein